MKKALFIGYIWPEPSTTAAGHRMLQLIHTLKQLGYHIIFSTTAVKSEHSCHLEAIGVESIPIKLNHSSFDVFIENLNPTFVIFDRFMMEEQFGWRVAKFAPQAIRILNTEDLHSLRKSRETCHKKDENHNLEIWKNHPMTLREVTSIYRCDLTLLVSSYELEILQNVLNIPKNLLLLLPFMLEPISHMEIEQWPTFAERNDFICVGNGMHAPNVDSIMALKQIIWPIIKKKLPKAKLQIYGAYLPQKVLEMQNTKEGFYVEGWIEDLEVVMQHARVNLAPLQFGAGIKGKLADAMCNGTPNVTTSIGAEGMAGNLPWNGSVSNTWEGFAEAAVGLHQNKEKWKKAQMNGIAIINSLYNQNIMKKNLMEHLAILQKDIEQHRIQNFIGKLLQQQTLSSTKYMSKWIEAKNKK
ncbi:MAG: glycosyltransferase [Flavobacteriaceae bacterium]